MHVPDGVDLAGFLRRRPEGLADPASPKSAASPAETLTGAAPMPPMPPTVSEARVIRPSDPLSSSAAAETMAKSP